MEVWPFLCHVGRWHSGHRAILGSSALEVAMYLLPGPNGPEMSLVICESRIRKKRFAASKCHCGHFANFAFLIMMKCDAYWRKHKLCYHFGDQLRHIQQLRKPQLHFYCLFVADPGLLLRVALSRTNRPNRAAHRKNTQTCTKHSDAFSILIRTLLF